jgi:anti-anti-sigma factor
LSPGKVESAIIDSKGTPAMHVVVVKATEELTHVSLHGRLDLPGVQQIEILFLAHTASRKKPTIVDLSDVPFMSSLGVGLLMNCARSLRNAKVKLVLLNPQQLVKDMLMASGIDKALPIASNVAEAETLTR